MPDVHGITLARMAALRRGDLKILYLTAHGDLPEIRDRATLGKLLRKPIRMADLRREVEEALD